MPDPLTQVVGLLRPSAPLSKLVTGSGLWAVRRADSGRPFYAAVLEGGCRLAIDGEAGIVLREGDFVLIPAAHAFTTTSLDPPRRAAPPPVEVAPGVFRLGAAEGPPNVRMLVGHCVFASSDADLLVSLLPRYVYVRGAARAAPASRYSRPPRTSSRRSSSRRPRTRRYPRAAPTATRSRSTTCPISSS